MTIISLKGASAVRKTSTAELWFKQVGSDRLFSYMPVF